MATEVPARANLVEEEQVQMVVATLADASAATLYAFAEAQARGRPGLALLVADLLRRHLTGSTAIHRTGLP